MSGKLLEFVSTSIEWSYVFFGSFLVMSGLSGGFIFFLDSFFVVLNLEPIPTEHVFWPVIVLSLVFASRALKRYMEVH